MKRISAVIMTLVLLFLSIFAVERIYDKTLETSSNIVSKRINLVIDAGHGGRDNGTSGVDDTPEKGINLDIALSLYDFACVSGINTYLTRDGDYQVYSENDDTSRSDLYNRMDFINSISNATLISIHQNHFEDVCEWGMQVWFSPNGNLSKSLADNILNITKDYLQPDNERNNKMSDDSYYLLYKAKVPSVMVECGFMSNEKENELLKNDDYQKKIAYSILLGTQKYICEEL